VLLTGRNTAAVWSALLLKGKYRQGGKEAVRQVQSDKHSENAVLQARTRGRLKLRKMSLKILNQPISHGTPTVKIPFVS
jgi:hypothetical protein